MLFKFENIFLLQKWAVLVLKKNEISIKIVGEEKPYKFIEKIPGCFTEMIANAKQMKPNPSKRAKRAYFTETVDKICGFGPLVLLHPQ